MGKFKQAQGLLVTSLLLLAGCFQQAGESYQPASVTEAPITVPDNPPQDANPPASDSGQTINESALTGFPATPTLGIDITVISPTRPLPATDVIATEPPTQDALATSAPAVRTPSSPLGPITPETSGQTLPGVLPSATPSGLASTPSQFIPEGASASAEECTYTIQRGDTLFRIATNNGTTVAELQRLNPEVGNGNLIQPGQVLRLPGCGDAAAAPLPATPAPDTSAPQAPAGGQTYTVQRGDTLFSIARQFGVTIQAIVQANSLSNPDRITPGQQLIIPPAGG